jgi:hypothetical protein
MKTIEIAQGQLDDDALDTVSGGDKAKDNALVGLYKAIDRLDLAQIDVEPVVHVPMKL